SPETKMARAEADAAKATKERLEEKDKGKSKSNTKQEQEEDKPAGPTRTSIALGAFGYALLFAVAGVGAGYAATLGARELIAHGHMLPGLGTRSHLVFPIVLGVVGVLPTCLVYRFGTVIKALVLGAALGGIGWVAWGTGQAAFLENRPIQAIAFGLSGFLA